MLGIRYFIMISAILMAQNIFAQQTTTLRIPDLEIIANKVTHGDGDVYGRGVWSSSFTIKQIDTTLHIDGVISFKENSNDFTEITGTVHQTITLNQLHYCTAIPIQNSGKVEGDNIGARGYRWFAGQGIIRRAWIQTDTFGNDAGKIGGKIQFQPIQIIYDCPMAAR